MTLEAASHGIILQSSKYLKEGAPWGYLSPAVQKDVSQ
jgi:hypothetical protein